MNFLISFYLIDVIIMCINMTHSFITDFYFSDVFSENWKANYLYCFVVFVIILERSLFCSSVISYNLQYLPTINLTLFDVIPELYDKYLAWPYSGRKMQVERILYFFLEGLFQLGFILFVWKIKPFINRCFKRLQLPRNHIFSRLSTGKLRDSSKLVFCIYHHSSKM